MYLENTNKWLFGLVVSELELKYFQLKGFVLSLPSQIRNSVSSNIVCGDASVKNCKDVYDKMSFINTKM